MSSVRALSSDELTGARLDALRVLLRAAFAADEHGGFDEDDWQHALGGVHLVAEEEGAIVAHAAVVERELHVGGRPIRSGYVEAVATRPDRQRSGLGALIMSAVNALIDERYELGALGTSSHGFYERLGWQIWRGPSYVRAPDGLRRTAEEDGYIMIRLTPHSPMLDLDAPITCDWRSGDVW